MTDQNKSKPEILQLFRCVTGLGILDANNALKETDWNIDKAIESVRKRLGIIIDSRSHKETREGVIESYIHVGGKIGVLIEVNCETDFVARNSEFREFVHNLCLQIAATNPRYITKEDVPIEMINTETKIGTAIAGDKPKAAVARIVGGYLERLYSSVCLLEQIYVKNTHNETVHDVMNNLIAKMKENIRIRRFTRYQIGV